MLLQREQTKEKGLEEKQIFRETNQKYKKYGRTSIYTPILPILSKIENQADLKFLIRIILT